MAKRIRLPNNWEPRDYQRKLWSYLESGGKNAVAVWHRRAGKDEVALHWTATAAHERIGTYWHMLPEANQARKAIWEAINPHTGIRRIDEAFPKDIRSNTREQDMMIKFKCGSTWQVVGSDNYDSLVGSPPIGVVKSEWALANPAASAYLQPILDENNGWDLAIYTPRGRNHGLSTYEAALTTNGSFAQVLTANDTDVFSAEKLQTIKEKYIKEHGETFGMAMFRQEFLCSFDAAVLGAVYGEWIEKAEQEGRITEGIYDPELKVNTTHDLGRSDAHAIWFYQMCLNEVRLIDYHEEVGTDPQVIAETMLGRKIIIDDIDKQSFAVTKWHYGSALPLHAHRAEYRYGDNFLPHDGAYKLQTARGRSFAQQLHEFGIKSFIIPATNQETNHSAARKILPHCFFERSRTQKGLNALRSYHFDYKQENRSLTKEPVHDWSSHGSKAFEIIGRTVTNPVQEEEKPKPRFLHEQTANELFFPEESGVKWRDRI